MSRKYRQAGYQDDRENRDQNDRPAQRPRRDLSFEEKIQRKSMRHAIDRDAREVLRCECGHSIEEHGAIGPQSTCPKCDTDLHCCRNCRFFASDARWQCRESIPEPVGNKFKANACGSFRSRLVLDHTGRRTQTSSPSQRSSGGRRNSNDPREAFNNLFKR